VKEADSTATSNVLERVRNPNDRDSWLTFFNLYAPLIHRQAIKAGLTEVEAQDVTQETLIETSQRIQTFQYDRSKGSFKAWLCQLARWRIANQFHKRRRTVPIEDSASDDDDSKGYIDQVPELVDKPDDSWEQEWRQTLFEAALKNLRQKLPSKQFQVLDLLIVKERAVSEVAQLFQINRAHVYVLKCHVVSALRREIKRLKTERS
jgi:RNA polymerase sigma-70 factor (ECF subfamily)